MMENNEDIKVGKNTLNRFYIIATLVVIVLSSILSMLEFSGSQVSINPVTNELESVNVVVKSLLNIKGLQYITGTIVSNFVNFTPLSMFIIASIGIGMLKKTGVLDIISHNIGNSLKKRTLTFIVAFISILSSVNNNLGYVIILPISAYIYYANKRHPFLGILTSFAGVTCGYAVNIFVSYNDYILSTYTKNAANILDINYNVLYMGNLFIMIAATILIAAAITYITESIMVKKLGKYKYFEEKNMDITTKDMKGMIYVFITCLIVLLIGTYAIFPSLKFSGFLLDNNESSYVLKLFGLNSYINKGLIPIISFTFILASYAFLKGASKKDNNYLSRSLDDIGKYVVFILFASIFISIYTESNIGVVLITKLSEIIYDVKYMSFMLIIFTLFVISLGTIFMPATQSKWYIFSPIVVPLFMQANMTPEFAQFIYRASDSITKGITPLLGYFVIYLCMLSRYKQKDEDLGIIKAIKLMLPYVITTGIIYLLIIICFYIIGIPLGPDVYPSL